MRHLAVLLLAFSAAGGQPQAARDLNERSLSAYSRGDYAAAQRLYKEAISAQALPEFEESLALFRRSLGMQDDRALDCMNILRGLKMIRGEYERADFLLGEALRTEREFRPKDATLAQTLSETAMLRLGQGRISEALAVAEESLELATKTAGEESADAAFAYTAVAKAHEMAGNPARALAMLDKSCRGCAYDRGTLDIEFAEVSLQAEAEVLR